MPGNSHPVRAAAIAALCFITAGGVSAYSTMPSGGHVVLTNTAVDLFNLCIEQGFGGRAYRLESEDRLTIVKANLDEDRTRPLRRVLNWHFYHPERESRQRFFLFINRSFLSLFERIESRMDQKETSRREALKNIGRAIHFFEDLTVPAHSVPVFHGAGVRDPFEVSPLSGTPASTELMARIAPHLKLVCSRLSTLRPYGPSENGLPGAALEEGSLSLRRILDSTRSFTLARLDVRICDQPGEAQVTWHYFWIPPKAHDFFGAYRSGAAFGEVKAIEENGSRCEITEAKYREFATELHLEAVFADVRALYLFSNRREGN